MEKSEYGVKIRLYGYVGAQEALPEVLVVSIIRNTSINNLNKLKPTNPINTPSNVDNFFEQAYSRREGLNRLGIIIAKLVNTENSFFPIRNTDR
jgi:hypothetical protein